MPNEDVELARTLDAVTTGLHAVGVHGVTVAQNPRSTIEPRLPHVASHENVALKVLGALAAQHPGREGASGWQALAIERTLGEGGMGVVHLATQVALGRKVAVKTLKAAHRSSDTTLKLLQEAWVTGRLEHPNIVPVYDIDVDASGGPVIVLKRIEGVHWGAVMHGDGALSRTAGAHDALEWNLRVLLSVCNAVHFAHSRGIVHRDLKPENVMIGEFGEVYVLDWGLAVSVGDDDGGRLPRASDAREIAGTPSYMAPEMLGLPAEDARAHGLALGIERRTDVYLLGGILFEILHGRAPHVGSELRAIVESILRSPPAVSPDAPEEAARIVARAMARSAADRYASVDELRQAIEALLEHRGSTRLSAKADVRREALEAEILRGAEATPELLFDLLGECRFGYRAALDAWKGNDAAAAGLDRALAAMARHELAHGSSRQASVLIGEMRQPSAELTRALDAKRRSEHEASLRVRALERLGADNDPTIGARTRTVGISVFFVVWTLGPLLTREYVTYAALKVSFTIFLVAAAAFGLLARETFSRTRFNRRLFGVLMLDLFGQLVLTVACAWTDVPLRLAEAWLVFLWATVLGAMAIFVDARLGVAALTALVGFFVAMRWPDTRYVVQSASTLVSGLSLRWIWRGGGAESPPDRASTRPPPRT